MARPKKTEQPVHKKYALLATCGLYPQIITVTICKLYKLGYPPDTVKIITTKQGKEACQFFFGSGALEEVKSLYNQQVPFIDPVADIIVAEDIPDIVGSSNDTQSFLNKCMEEAYRLTADLNTEVIFSVSGGAKNMSLCMVMSAQFFGRRGSLYPVDDKICHIFGPKELERTSFFETPSEDSVKLVDLPVIYFRNSISPKHIDKATDPAIAKLCSIINNARSLVVNLDQGEINWSGVILKLPAVEFSLYQYMLNSKLSCPYETCDNCPAVTCGMLIEKGVVTNSNKKRYDDTDSKLIEELAELYDLNFRGRADISQQPNSFLSRSTIHADMSSIKKRFFYSFGINAHISTLNETNDGKSYSRYFIAVNKSIINTVSDKEQFIVTRD